MKEKRNAIIEKLENLKKLTTQTGHQVIKDFGIFSLNENGPEMQILRKIGEAEKLIGDCRDIAFYYDVEESGEEEE